MSELGATVAEIFRVLDRMKVDGATPDDRQRFVETTLRTCWPFTREWHFLCPVCDDTGLEMRTCGGQTNSPCGFRKEHRAHDYGRPCTCKLGLRFEKRQRSAEDLVDAAARTSRPMRQAGR